LFDQLGPERPVAVEDLDSRVDPGDVAEI